MIGRTGEVKVPRKDDSRGLCGDSEYKKLLGRTPYYIALLFTNFSFKLTNCRDFFELSRTLEIRLKSLCTPKIIMQGKKVLIEIMGLEVEIT